jgi:hypothetical protein
VTRSDAELLANAAHEGLSGQRPLESALAEYHQQRDAATLPEYLENLQWAQLGPIPSDILALRQGLRDKPEDSRHFMLARYGRMPYMSFFNPANLARILGTPAAAAAVA